MKNEQKKAQNSEFEKMTLLQKNWATTKFLKNLPKNLQRIAQPKLLKGDLWKPNFSILCCEILMQNELKLKVGEELENLALVFATTVSGMKRRAFRSCVLVHRD